MGEIILTVVVGLLASGLFTGLGAAAYKSYKERGHRSDNAWDQRDEYRYEAHIYLEALMTQRTICHREHDMAYADMPPVPKPKG